MITKSDWEAVQQEMSEEDRRKLGEPPTAEEMLAYSRGALSGERAAHVRAWLACNPDLVRALMEPFPAADAKPGDPDFLSSEEMARQWTILQQRIDAPKGTARVYQFPSRWTALAAALALVFAGLYWQAQTKASRLTRELHAPRALESQLLLPDGRRGAEQATPLSAQGERFVLDLALFDGARFDTYRVEMREASADPAQSPWRSDAIRAAGEETLSIDVTRTYLKPGKYQIVVFGIDGTREQRLETYTLRVP
ncbi:MAG: hypothetical protein M3P06_00735 [Acidobacteriota bacterium]|nr:hypothetical protein [Acidobacteriota bacterium]